MGALYSCEYISPETVPIAAIYLTTTERSTLCFGHSDYLLCVCHINNDCLWGLHTLWLPLIVVRFKILLTISNYPKQSEDMDPPKFCIGDYNITIWFLIYLCCKLIKSMGCHMLDIDFRGVWWTRSRLYHYPTWTVENSNSFIPLTKGRISWTSIRGCLLYIIDVVILIFNA